ncbi:energy-coupling factor ABC transporter ATP-binding protein [Pediococcus acidilactici]|nr:energy-coupling factor ABC transporter ATP-binding protein [Pediococcus acidilactici]
MEILQVKDLNFKYALAKKVNLAKVNLSVNQGDFTLIIGDSGSGKTTLLRQLKKELWPVGERHGTIKFKNQPLEDLSPIESAQKIGMVFQNPDDQLVMDTVIQELAFSLENVGEDSDNIQRKIAEMVSFFGFQDILYASVNELSGGQKQLVNLAAVLILQPELLLLDEPTAQLDPIATKEFISLLQRVHDELGVTIMISEHQLDELLPLATQLCILEEGKLTFVGKVSEGIQRAAHSQKLAEFIPEIPRLFLTENVITDSSKATVPLTVVDGKRFINNHKIKFQQQKRSIPQLHNDPVLKATHVDFKYERNDPLILNDLALTVQRGEWLSIVGRNGTGKSTLLKCLTGMQKTRRGKISVLNRKLTKWTSDQLYEVMGYLSQNPADHFSYDTVSDEFVNRAKELGLTDPQEVGQAMLSRLKINSLKNKNPHDTSGGEKQLIALGIILIGQPKILLLDEPTKGLDPLRKRELGKLLQKLQETGMTIITTSHDMSFSATYATRCAMLFDGKITSVADPYAFFTKNFFYTTPINRMVRDQLPEALIWRELNYE